MHFVICSLKNDNFSLTFNYQSQIRSKEFVFYICEMSISALITPLLSPPPVTQESTTFSVDLWVGSLGWHRKGPSSPGDVLLMFMLYQSLKRKICDSLQLSIRVPLLSMSTGTAVCIFISICCIYILLLDKTTPLSICRAPEGMKLKVVNYSFPRVSVSILRRGCSSYRCYWIWASCGIVLCIWKKATTPRALHTCLVH